MLVKSLFICFLISLHINGVGSRSLTLDRALAEMRERLEQAAADIPTTTAIVSSTTSLTIEPPSTSPSTTVITYGESADSTESHVPAVSVYRSILRAIAEHCRGDELMCRDLTDEVESVLADYRSGIREAGPTVLEVLGSVSLIFLSVSIVTAILAGLMVMLDHLLPTQTLWESVRYGFRILGECLFDILSAVRWLGQLCRPVRVERPVSDTEEDPMTVLRRGFLEHLESRINHWEQGHSAGGDLGQASAQVRYGYPLFRSRLPF